MYSAIWRQLFRDLVSGGVRHEGRAVRGGGLPPESPRGGLSLRCGVLLPDGPVDPGLLDVIVDGHPGYPVDYGAALLVVENCVSSTPWDADGDGANEIVVRTRWPEKPYTVYDMLDGEVQAVSWPDAVPEEVRENLMCIWEQ